MLLGMVFGVVLTLLTLNMFPSVESINRCLLFLAFGVVLYLPTVLQPYLQHRIYKIFARCLLGLAVVVMWYGAMFLFPYSPIGVVARIAFVVVFVGIAALTLAARKRCAKRPWESCAKGGYPFCSDNLQCQSMRIRNRTCDFPNSGDVLTILLAKTAGETAGEVEFIHASQLLNDENDDRLKAEGPHETLDAMQSRRTKTD